jgi:nitrite reductase (NADH) small subunit
MAANAVNTDAGRPAAGFRPVARLDELELDRFRLVEIEGREVNVVRTEAGVFAIGNRCPHQGARLCAGHVTGTMLPSDPDEYVYGQDDVVVRCPWHGFEFSLRTGESFGGAITGRVPTYPVEVRDGVVYCSLSRARVSDEGTR